MKKNTSHFYILLCFALSAFNIFAQHHITVIDSTADGTIKFALIENQVKTKSLQEPRLFLKDVLKANNETDFHLYNFITDEQGMTHEKYQQTFKGVKVEFAEFIVHKNASGNITSINGEFDRVAESFTSKPSSTFKQTFDRFNSRKDARPHILRNLPTQNRLKKAGLEEDSTYETVVLKDKEGKTRLAYKISLQGEAITDSYLGYIDCESGDLILSQALVNNTNTTGTAATLYSGNRSITTDATAGRFRLYETSRRGTGTIIRTLNFNNISENNLSLGISSATEITDNDNNWTATEFSGNRAALDAHWGAEITFDYFNIVHGRKSYDNNNAVITSYVNVGQNYQNAFWNDGFKSMFYGGTSLNPLVTDEQGMTHEKYQQTFKGVKVEFAEFIVHKNASGNITSINGEFDRVAESFTSKPSSTFKQTFDRFNSRKDARPHILRNLPTQNRLKKAGLEEDSTYETVVLKDKEGKTRLAYKISLQGEAITDSYLGYIDCESGDLILSQALVNNTNTTGTAATLYSGNRSITTDATAGRFRLYETSRRGTGTIIRTLNFNNISENNLSLGISSATEITDNDNNWTATEFSGNRAALDAHWGAEITFDYFNIVHGRKSYDNNNAVITSYVNVGQNYQNAFWNDGFKSMFYGGTSLNPLVSLDICAHEIGHGICFGSVGNGVGLLYEGESGALNESLSDIWGACVEQWATTDKQTWIMGEDPFWGVGLRSMSNPNTFSHPNTYQGAFWKNTANVNDDKGGVHTNSGIGNFWFYLLSQGGSGKNDKGNVYYIQGIGIDKASKIAYRMETAYLTAKSNYSDARIASLNAAINLYGLNSDEYVATNNAWHAVGIGNVLPPNVLGPLTLCLNSTGSYTIKNMPLTVIDSQVTWLCSTGLQIQGGNTGRNKTLKAITATTGWVEATYTLNGTKFTTNRLYIDVGIPQTPTDISGFYDGQQFSPNTTYSFSIEGVDRLSGDLTYNWSVSGGTISGDKTKNGIYINTNSLPKGQSYIPFMISVNISNKCGMSFSFWREGYIGTAPSEWGILSNKSTVLSNKSVVIYDLFSGEVVYRNKNVFNFNIENTNLKKGFYILERIDEDGNIKRDKVIKK